MARADAEQEPAAEYGFSVREEQFAWDPEAGRVLIHHRKTRTCTSGLSSRPWPEPATKTSSTSMATTSCQIPTPRHKCQGRFKPKSIEFWTRGPRLRLHLAVPCEEPEVLRVSFRAAGRCLAMPLGLGGFSSPAAASSHGDSLRQPGGGSWSIQEPKVPKVLAPTARAPTAR